MVSAMASLLLFIPSGNILIASAMPDFTISSSSGISSKGEIFLGSSASM